MFQDLFHLYKTHNNAQRIPLEDFNTEAFAGILKMHPEVLTAFCDLLGLPKGDYRVSTQGFYNHELLNCYVDLILENENMICFIENKVDSSEGFEQLKRYSEVLDKDYPKHKKNLVYCTKHNDPKNQKGEYNPYNFQQLRWYEIAKLLRTFIKKLPIVKDYLKFLEKHKMAQDNTIRIENIFALENLKKTVDIMLFYIDQSKQDFASKFGIVNGNFNYQWAELNKSNRFAKYALNPLFSEKGKHSEILYSIDFDSSKINVQLFIVRGHEQEAGFKRVGLNNQSFKFDETEWGCRINIEESLGDFLNKEDGDKLIKDWFNNSFIKFKALILDSKTLKWEEKFFNRLKK